MYHEHVFDVVGITELRRRSGREQWMRANSSGSGVPMSLKDFRGSTSRRPDEKREKRHVHHA
jgi:hypothetical protein